MSTSTKTPSTAKSLFSGFVVAAGQAVGFNSSATQTLTTTYGSIISGFVQNPNSGLGVGCTVRAMISNDQNYYDVLGQIVAAVSAQATTTFVFGIPAPVQYVMLDAGGNTTNAVTLSASITTLVTI